MVESAGLSLTEHQRKWLRRLRACEVSGKSFTEYATEHDFPVRELYDAKKTLVNKGVLPRTQQERIQRVQTVTESANFRNYAELIVMRGYTVLSSSIPMHCSGLSRSIEFPAAHKCSLLLTPSWWWYKDKEHGRTTFADWLWFRFFSGRVPTPILR